MAELVITKEFPAELAGERVGWTTVHTQTPPEDMPAYHVVNVALGTVAESGGYVGYEEFKRENGTVGQGVSDRSVQGLERVAALTVAFSREREFDSPYSNMYFVDTEKGPNARSATGVILGGASSADRHDAGDEAKRWGMNTAEVIAGLHAGLEEEGIGDYYERIYYLLNMYLGHDHFSHSPNRYDEMLSRYVPDPNQQDETQKQIGAASEVVQAFTGIAEEDRKMKQRLTVFSDLPKEQVPDVFAESRRNVAAREQTLRSEVLPKMFVSGLVYVPVGFRPAGRSWPYMDPTEADENKAFGLELEDLKVGQVGRADHELDRELKELRHRKQYAEEGLGSLSLLRAAELRAAGNS